MSTEQYVQRNIQLAGRRVLITGAGGGIGEGIAKTAAGLGAAVAINDISSDAAERVTSEIVKVGGDAIAISGDLTDEVQAATVVSQAAVALGGLDGLVNNAGITGKREFEQIDRDDWDRVMALNLSAPFRLSVLAAPYLRESAAGRIVNIASIAGIRISVLGGAAYTASKAGLIGLTRHLAMELASDGVTVNAVLPGITVTPLVRAQLAPLKLAEIEQTVPLGRAAVPEDIGWLVSFLLSQQSGYMSGTATEVDGALAVLPGDFTSYRSSRGEDKNA